MNSQGHAGAIQIEHAILGPRIPVYDMVASMSAGLPRDRILAVWPGLDDDSIDLAVLYAEANPVRGRPRRFAALPSDAAIVSERTVSRRRRASAAGASPAG
ncbi:MAG: DUF433 domain-containing protein [Magnetospirillum sp.]|nr:DUF433 domain-containing protein [Magnetospirillum sp.]